MCRAVAGSVVLLCGLLGCEDAGEQASVAAEGAPICRVAQQLRTLPDKIDEASGAAVSRDHSGVIWTHNDSGDPQLFAVDAGGTLHGRVSVPGAENQDWEDLALSACASGDCLYIADIGDNAAQRQQISLYRIPEPHPTDSVAPRAEQFSMRYPDGPRDAEALFVLPGERVYLVTKGSGGPIELYAYPGVLDPTRTVELQMVRRMSTGTVSFGDLVTGGAATPDGDWIALRTYASVLLYRADELLADGPVTPAHVGISGLGEAQGEGIAILENGSVVLVSEGAQGGFPGSVGLLWCGLQGFNSSAE